MDIPSGTSCMQIATASEYPNVKDAPNPDPIANPSGKLCSANPILVIIPVLSNSLLVSVLEFLILNFLSTAILQIIIHIIPKTIPITAFGIEDIFSASGIRSKLNIAVIRPDANDNMKLRILSDGFLNFIPIIPPMVVPNVPKNNPINVTFNNSLNKITSRL